MYKKLLFTLYVLSVTLFPQQGHALFDDKEARKKILSIETQMVEKDAATDAEISDLKKQIQDLEKIVKGQGLADLLNQIEILNHDVEQLKGELELVNHQLETIQQREKELYVDTDERIRKLEEALEAQALQAEEASAAALVVDPIDITSFKEANALLKQEQYKDAYSAFDAFLKQYPESTKTDEAMYGLGYAQFSLKNYKSAIATQQKLLKQFPDTAKAPEAMMNIGNSQIQLGRVKSAKKTFKALIKQYPDNSLVPTAEGRLKALSAF